MQCDKGYVIEQAILVTLLQWKTKKETVVLLISRIKYQISSYKVGDILFSSEMTCLVGQLKRELFLPKHEATEQEGVLDGVGGDKLHVPDVK